MPEFSKAAFHNQPYNPLGRPKRLRLAHHQEAKAVKLIAERCPDQLNLPFSLWTLQAVCQLLATRFGLRVSTGTAGRYLRRWGLTPQKPLRKAYERNPGLVELWLQKEYGAIHAKAKEEKAEIHWSDETGLYICNRSEQRSRKHIHTEMIPGANPHFGCNIISTITGRGTLRFMLFQGGFTQPILLTFLRRLLPSVKGKVFLIANGHHAYQGNLTKRWLIARQDRITLFFLPRRLHIKRRRTIDSGHLVANWLIPFQVPMAQD
jgi:transposase